MFENLSIASQMNQLMINIKVDREERPDIDELYMVARQLLTHEGGWPNNVFLTPELKPFYAGGTFAPDESHGIAAFPRLLEWINYSWTTQETETRAMADQITDAMRPHLVFNPPPEIVEGPDASQQADELFKMLLEFYDGRAGGFFQAPKFPHECLLTFLIGYYEHSNVSDTSFNRNVEAIDMVSKTLRKMASGGIYDHVGGGFHRYAVDKDWFCPHFEKMLYNQAMLARVYTDAARLTGNEYFADIARSILDFVRGPLTHATGAFYSAIDAEVDGVEGAYYVWQPEEFSAILNEEEITFLMNLYALADVPNFPGHKPTKGQALVARRPLDELAKERQVPYVELAATVGHVMNKLLLSRNVRQAPTLDDKIIVSWNGLMIDAFAHAGKTLGIPSYLLAARRAVDFLLEHAIDNDGALNRIYINGQPNTAATLEDYAYLIKGILSLWRATPDDVLLEAAQNLLSQVDERFTSKDSDGYFFSQPSDRLLIRSSNCDDMTIPNANSVMAHNLIDLFEITRDEQYSNKAHALCGHFLDGKPQITIEAATIIHAALRLDALVKGKILDKPLVFDTATRVAGGSSIADEVVSVSAEIIPADAGPGDDCEIVVRMEIQKGWHVNANEVNHSFLIPTRVQIQGPSLEHYHFHYPAPLLRMAGASPIPLTTFSGRVTMSSHAKLKADVPRTPLQVMVRFQPCTEEACYNTQDIVLTV